MVTCKKFISCNVPMFARRKSELKKLYFKSCITGHFRFLVFYFSIIFLIFLGVFFNYSYSVLECFLVVPPLYFLTWFLVFIIFVN